MATTPFDPSHFTPNAFDIYTDAVAIKAPTPSLPGGACGFVDLNPGANGARCGCRRFWSRCPTGNLVPDQSQWCMCNHHACYHEEGSRDVQQPEVGIPGQENERPRTGREPLSPVVDIAIKTPPVIPGMDFSSFTAGAFSFIQRTPDQRLSDQRISADTGQFSRIPASQNLGASASIPDTLSWGGLLQSQSCPSAIPPIPAQCLIASQTASTTSSAQAKYLRPFAGKGLHTLNGLTAEKPPSPTQANTQDVPPTSVPQNQAPPADSFTWTSQDYKPPDTPRASTPTQSEHRATAFNAAVSRRAFKNLSDIVSGHDQRLDRLETVSFTAAGHEECHEKHDHADIRMTDLESRVEEVEKLVNDNKSVLNDSNSVTSRRGDDASVISVSTSTTSRPTHSQELWSQVQSLQAQVVQLQSLMPSPNHPFEIEVVFLPFPLKKVWQEAQQFKNEPQISNDDWTQLPMTHSTATLRSEMSLYPDWMVSDQDTKWLLPKACADKGVIDRRLRSRGLIKTISVKGSDARSVTMAMNAAFGHLFREMNIFSRPQTTDPRSSSFLGLQSTWVPLRKIHKDSRLRFLSPAEMMTPAVWDVQFLSQVMMRASEPRLFVTHPDAYLQDFQAYEMGWTWQMLREMSPVAPDSSASLDEGKPYEECWSWVEQLDEPPSASNSMSVRHDKAPTSSSPSQTFYPALQSIKSASPSMTRAQSPLLSRRGSRPPHIRTSSMPMSAPIQASPALSRRRVASYGQSRRSSPALHANSQSAIMKRRRTRSPSHRFTPRWTASPSPMPLGIHDRQPARGTTPFAYATPYSNAPLQERPIRAGSAAPVPAQDDFDDDSDFNIEIYESGSEDMEDAESVNDMEIVTHNQALIEQVSQGWQLPEDEPWPGIEDQREASDGENVDPHQTDPGSNVSSQPSEYPSTQNAWPDNNAAEFHIHEDDDNRS
ncbi:hypothetical protein FOPG_02964 [Fusarium oxysporum f. sp. conglutinans race 2 54008]|uniref:Uncharacterized protein n=4 Tax=Fusarium oxysporum TaxID=5507 RepID=A0A8H6GFD4_FUSOX|nr:hypothetical protein FOVG_06001 [Fusarium oxysporum f. sp. pisi HDV247]EXL85019.1 hypothetical protein FOPG_02964 [Fusarium oxysporum f. sp. conglutinans race 2 54008]KAF6516550.1 hypothetical protein HZS61_003753 [Fusarium oxysporum f. sp. conglutinans]KAI8403131.1 hypothetical protein FOFC_16565 [Fusarium oxysporum]WKT44848.1 hypothetical protein QSH57_009701 [Fusarium oxysporum f. sp. vasinfectum]